MPNTAPPAIENQRLEALGRLHFRDGQIEEVFDHLARVVALTLRSPIGLVSVAGADLLLTRGVFGCNEAEVPADNAFCVHTMRNPEGLTLVEDASIDPRFSASPMVAGAPDIRFFAGAALRNPGGVVVGVLGVLGRARRTLDSEQQELLRALARHMEVLIRMRAGRIRAATVMTESARAEHAEHDRLLAIVSASVDLMSLIDRDYVYQYVNPTYLTYWRRSQGEIVGHGVSDLLGQAVFDTRIKPLLDRAFGGETVRYEAAFDFPLTGPRRTLVSYTPARDRYGAITGVVANVRDIDDLRRGEDHLAAAVGEIEEAQSVSRVGSWDWTPGNGRVTGSREFFRLFDAEDAHFDDFGSVFDRLHSSDRSGFEDMLRIAGSGERAYDLEFRLRLNDGGYRHLHARARAHLDEGGAVMRVVGTCQDISDRKAAERALRDSVELNRVTFEQAAVGIAHVGTDGSWLHVNDRLCQIVGYERRALLKLTFQDITHPDDLGSDLDFVPRVLSGELRTHSIEKRYVRRDGSLVWVNLTVSLVRDASGIPVHFISIVEDIDARKRAEFDLETHRRSLARTVVDLEDRTVALQRFIHILSHDMREPLNTIVNFSGLLAEHPVLSTGKEGKYLEYLSTGARRMRFLLDDLLQYVRLDRAEARDVEVDMNAIVTDVRNDLAAQIGLAGATVNATPLPVVRGDASLLRVVLQNLVSNAIKFVAPGTGPVILIGDESEDPEWWRLAVRDNGIGIPQEALSSLFAPFTRLNTRANYAGTGLGLATCKRVAEMHGGRIEVSSSPGRGSRFTLLLPRRRH